MNDRTAIRDLAIAFQALEIASKAIMSFPSGSDERRAQIERADRLEEKCDAMKADLRMTRTTAKARKMIREARTIAANWGF
jgi:hypothetical protein